MGLLPLLAGWLAWATLASMPVAVLSSNARSEVEGNVVPIDVPESGRVTASHLLLGKQVEIGEALVELDATLDRARYAELEVRRDALLRKLEPLRSQKSAALAIQDAQRKLGGASVAVAAVRAQAAKREAARGAELLAISQRLSNAGLESKSAEIESGIGAQRRADTMRENAAEVSRTVAAMSLDLQRLALQDLELARALTDAEAEHLQLTAQMKTAELQIERRTIRASARGYLGDVAPLNVGMMIRPGHPVATIIPDGRVNLVATLPPHEAVGRVEIGQKVNVRFEAFPWTQFGLARGTVVRYGVEPQKRDGSSDGGVRVEVALEPDSLSRIPLRHGMPASVEIIVGRATPFHMFLRTIGKVTNDARTPSGSKGMSPSESAR